MYKKSILKNKKTTLVIIILILTGLSTFVYFKLHNKNVQHKNKKSSYFIDCTGLNIPDSVKISPSKTLNDKNDVHLAYAKIAGLDKLFISNQELEEECVQMIKEQTLVKIESNPTYYVKDMKYSYPYVVPAMGDLLNEISFRFKNQLPKKIKDDFRFVITSALRTNETQQNLSKYNRNASPTSAHLYGATVDISYKDFFNTKKNSLVQDWEAMQALTRAMQELRMECRLVTVRERHQACFHTTVVICNK